MSHQVSSSSTCRARSAGSAIIGISLSYAPHALTTRACMRCALRRRSRPRANRAREPRSLGQLLARPSGTRRARAALRVSLLSSPRSSEIRRAFACRARISQPEMLNGIGVSFRASRQLDKRRRHGDSAPAPTSHPAGQDSLGKSGDANRVCGLQVCDGRVSPDCSSRCNPGSNRDRATSQRGHTLDSKRHRLRRSGAQHRRHDTPNDRHVVRRGDHENDVKSRSGSAVQRSAQSAFAPAFLLVALAFWRRARGPCRIAAR